MQIILECALEKKKKERNLRNSFGNLNKPNKTITEVCACVRITGRLFLFLKESSIRSSSIVSSHVFEVSFLGPFTIPFYPVLCPKIMARQTALCFLVQDSVLINNDCTMLKELTYFHIAVM